MSHLESVSNRSNVYAEVALYDQKKLIELRRYVNELYFHRRLSKRAIARQTGMSRDFVNKWTESADQEFIQDKRGWKKGLRRKWDQVTEDRIREIHEYLVTDPNEFYVGATSIAQVWRNQYPDAPIPPLRTIGQIMKDLGLTKSRKSPKRKGAARYLCYPEHTVYTLGNRVMESDFIGGKYIRGVSKPIHFIGFSLKKPPKMRYYKRVSSPSADCFISTSAELFQTFEIPDCMKMDNGPAMIGSSSGKRNISRVMAFLFKHQVIPIFSVPRKPFSQASIEGNNSVFARKFWKSREFSSLDEIDEHLTQFNAASQRYHGYEPPKTRSRKSKFRQEVYFLRQVGETDETSSKGWINILNERVLLPEEFINYFVISHWDITREKLITYIESEKTLNEINKICFQVNKRSLKLLI